MGLNGVQWDRNKAAQNLAKHHVSFETAQYVFLDPDRLERFDLSENNRAGEERWQVLGNVEDTLLVVYQDKATARRLISARLATKAEKRSYYGYYQIDGKGWTKAE
ncbi:MAG: BrnT family toxin [Spirochaetaceae bacterium]|jgi:uncharacterized DUF497 family protein|nr:BrnT family toxin [Spirochaetaceae bacterium]